MNECTRLFPTAALAFLCLVGSSGCVSCDLDNPKYHALFGDDARDDRDLTGRPVTRVFLDQDGSLYPHSDVFLKNQTIGRFRNNLTLTFCSETNDLPKWQQRYAAADPDGSSNSWERVQAAIRAELCKSLNEKCRTSNGVKTLVVLVGGFNEAERKKGYACAEDYILSHRLLPPSRAHFLEVHWDGLTRQLGAWAAGQHNSTFAGRNFRRVLNELDKDIPLRFVTHSRGAGFVSSALWNVETVTRPTSERHDRVYSELATNPTPTQASVRVAMIAAAIPSDTFLDYRRQSPPDRLPHYQRIIIAQNRKDYAVSKLCLPSTWFGATDLGCRQSAFRAVEQNVSLFGQALLVEMRGSSHISGCVWGWPFTAYWENHEFTSYLSRDTTATVFHLLFDAVPKLAKSP